MRPGARRSSARASTRSALGPVNRYREVKLDHCRQLLGTPAPVVALSDAPMDYRDRYQRLTGVSLRDCPHCGRGQMVRIESFLPGTLPRGPPANTS